MKIHITKKEYRLLVDMLYLSDWMMHSHLVGSEENPYQALRKKLLSYYKDMEAENIIKYYKEFGDYYQSRDYEEKMLHFIDAYNEQTFWDALADRLSKRDLLKEIGVKAYENLEGIERVIKLGEIANRYDEEFAKHGLEHVKVVKSNVD